MHPFAYILPPETGHIHCGATGLTLFKRPYLEACIEEEHGDAAFIAKALGEIVRAQGMTEIARQTGLSRESLYKALTGERSPSFDTELKVISALGLKLSACVSDEAELA
ncbi:MAG: putative addiction module antidote protein [Cyanobacteria bacterium K_DeepCast_35m_m2_023]|nr:putative addiction module antidote protein [Cyanobacteria bacterium K_DeepCast_35m_m2_023]